MTESRLRQVLCSLLRYVGQDPVAIEDALRVGTPDVNALCGWFECKVLQNWPKRPDTPVRLPHSRRVSLQTAWLRRRWQRGGGAYLLLTVGDEWLILNGVAAYDAYGNIQPVPTREELITLAFGHWPRQPTALDLLQAVRNERIKNS